MNLFKKISAITTDLKPCFYGADKLFFGRRGSRYLIYCFNCNRKSKGITKEECIENWEKFVQDEIDKWKGYETETDIYTDKGAVRKPQ